MAPVTSRAVVLRSHRLGETSKVVVCYTETRGKVRLVAKGGRKGGSRVGAALGPFMVSGVVFYLRPGRDLSIVSQADVERDFPDLRRDAVRMAYGSAVLELVDRVVSGEEPDAALFALIVETLAGVEAAERDALDRALLAFGFALARSLGYEAAFDACVLCSAVPGADALFAPRHGGLVCGACQSKDRGIGLTRRPATVALADAAAGRAPAVAVSRAAADEAWDAFCAFLEEHTGRALRLKSLDVLAQLRRAERADPTTPTGRKQR
jgi:DNA repair protein RecO (recombination protein O)